MTEGIFEFIFTTEGATVKACTIFIILSETNLYKHALTFLGVAIKDRVA